MPPNFAEKGQVSVVHLGGKAENSGSEPQGLQRSASLSGRPSQLAVHIAGWCLFCFFSFASFTISFLVTSTIT